MENFGESSIQVRTDAEETEADVTPHVHSTSYDMHGGEKLHEEYNGPHHVGTGRQGEMIEWILKGSLFDSMGSYTNVRDFPSYGQHHVYILECVNLA